MRIVMLAPIKRPLTPDTTVSRPRVMVDLSLGLLKKGHRVTIIGTADSRLPGAGIIGVVPKGLNYLPVAENEFYQHTSYLTLMIAEMVRRQGEFDIVHNHMYPEYLPLLAEQNLQIPLVTTVHSQMTGLTATVLRQFPRSRFVAISRMAKDASGIASMHVIHNSVDVELFRPEERVPKSYLMAVGRMSKAKNADGSYMDPKGIQNAIKVAQLTGERLKIVGNVEDEKFFEMYIKPHLNDKIEFVGKVSSEQNLTRAQMVKLFQGAKALVNAINWEEPFGLVMAEAMACGTPVVAYNRGAVGEIVRDGETGFVVEPESQQSFPRLRLGQAVVSRQTEMPKNNPTHPPHNQRGGAGGVIKKRGLEGIVEAIRRIGEIDRRACREHAVTHFSTQRMVDEYEILYNSLLKQYQTI